MTTLRVVFKSTSASPPVPIPVGIGTSFIPSGPRTNDCMPPVAFPPIPVPIPVPVLCGQSCCGGRLSCVSRVAPGDNDGLRSIDNRSINPPPPAPAPPKPPGLASSTSPTKNGILSTPFRSVVQHVRASAE
ncbi:hypothetical protein M422DRAFT_247029 [Sphaerobolus stellatus SS14]|nr:hypothetical protein M422DRAFT_247029 [Sphaerobolus stellatus SS14]